MKINEILNEEVIRADKSTFGRLARQLVTAAVAEHGADVAEAKKAVDAAAKEIYHQILTKVDNEFKRITTKEINK